MSKKSDRKNGSDKSHEGKAGCSNQEKKISEEISSPFSTSRPDRKLPDKRPYCFDFTALQLELMSPCMEYDDSCSFINSPALAGWTKNEKLALLHGIKERGSHDKAIYEELIPTKTPEQIELAVNFYRKRATKHPSMAEQRRRNKRNVVNIPRTPFASWAKFLTDSYSMEELQTEVSTALQLIADFESMPACPSTDFIDFRKCYYMAANAAQGKLLQEDKHLSMVIDKAMVDTALLSKSFIQNSALSYLLHNIDTSEQPINVFTRPTSNNELLAVEHLASQNNFNPLHIPGKYLRASKS